MEEKKTSTIALLRILEEYSDEEHILSRSEIANLIETNYNLTIDRRTLYRDINILKNYGFDISEYSDNFKGYYLRERLLEGSEIQLLCNAIHSSHFIPAKASKDLIDKLLSTQSLYKREDYRRNVFVNNENKKENKQFFLNIELITKAIRDHRVIKFMYTKYSINKNLVNYRKNYYHRSPYYIVVNGDKAYMVAKGKGHNSLSHFRIDRMRDIRFTFEDYIMPLKKEDAYSYAKNRIYMFSGEETNVVFRCKDKVLDYVIDTFGKSVKLTKEDDSILVETVCGKEDIKKFAMQYLDSVELLEPQDLRKEVRKTINDATKRYQK